MKKKIKDLTFEERLAICNSLTKKCPLSDKECMLCDPEKYGEVEVEVDEEKNENEDEEKKLH